MSTPPDDPDLDEYLAGASRLSRDYATLGREQPPASVDARIRAEAAAAVRPKPRAPRAPLWWLRPAALAATVVVAVSLVLRLAEVPQPTFTSAPMPQAAPPVEVQLHADEPMADESARMASSAKTPPPAMPAQPLLSKEAAGLSGHENLMRDEQVLAASQAPAARESLRQVPVPEAEVAAPQARSLADTSLNQVKRGLVAGMTATGTPEITPERLARCIDAIRLRLASPGPVADALTAPAAAMPTQKAEAPSAESRLRAILALHDAGRADTAASGLAEFARDFPDDPVAVLLTAAAE